MRARDLVAVTSELLKANPQALLRNNPACTACDAATRRGACSVDKKTGGGLPPEPTAGRFRIRDFNALEVSSYRTSSTPMSYLPPISELPPKKSNFTTDNSVPG